jgi:hypothetical protein
MCNSTNPLSAIPVTAITAFCPMEEEKMRANAPEAAAFCMAADSEADALMRRLSLAMLALFLCWATNAPADGTVGSSFAGS